MRSRARLRLAPRLNLLPLFRRFSLALLLLSLTLPLLPARPALADFETVLLRPGTTLAEVAAQWNTTPETLRYLNNMSPTDLAWSGMRMRVPEEEWLIVYTVQEGETPSKVAARHGMTLARLVELNDIAPSRRLRAGEQLLVDSAEGILATQELPIHTVQAGETLATLADTYGTSERVLRRVNTHVNVDRLRPGARLAIAPRSLHERLGELEHDTNGYLRLDIKDFPSLTEKWIDIDLSEQRLTAYEGTRPVLSVLISSGRSPTPTVRGVFRIRAKVASQRMEGGSREDGTYYNLANVQWVAYFYGAYALHGAYWHKNFGHPMSHGCINLTNEDAKFLYEWTGPTNPGRSWYDSTFEDMGTLVIVHH